MADKEKKVAFIDEEELNFLYTLASLPTEKKILVKGIMIGMELRSSPEQAKERRMAV